jgi:hypothetical protein
MERSKSIRDPSNEGNQSDDHGAPADWKSKSAAVKINAERGANNEPVRNLGKRSIEQFIRTTTGTPGDN